MDRMGVYVVTGGMNGIGKATVEILRKDNNIVYVVDNEGGDIVADLGKDEERQFVIRRIHEICPDGIDGLACIAGVSFPCPDNGSVISINYFGTTVLCEGLFDLLQKKNGRCIVTVSGSALWADDPYYDNLASVITECQDEARIIRLVNKLSSENGYMMYGTTKYALIRWMRRHSTEWGARGVRLNAIGPGCVNTRLGNAPAPPNVKLNESFHMTIPTHYSDLSLMKTEELGNYFAFMLSDKSIGANGMIAWVDAGQGTYYHTERIH